MKQVYYRFGVLLLVLTFLSSGKIYAQLTATVTTQVNDLCFGDATGYATVTASGGTGPYTYLWSPSGATTATANALVAGVYTCTVTDQAMATATATVSITQPVQLSISMTSTPATCGQFNGTATAIPSGGNPPYSYNWTPVGATSSTATNLTAGVYTITVVDANGCIATNTAVITNVPGPTAFAGNDTTICNGGSANLMCGGTGGQPPYTFLWSPGNFTGCNVPVTPATTTTYTMMMTDANGCSSTDAITIYVGAGLNLTFASSPATCAQSNGTLSVLPAGGVSPYTYLWSTSSTNDTIVNLAAGLYSVDVTDANGCTTSGTSSVNNASGPIISFATTDATCYGGTNGTATASVAGNAPPYAFSWNTTPVQAVQTAVNLAAGTYFCTVTDTNNCQSSSPVTILQPPQMYLGAQLISSANCLNNGSVYAWATGGTAPYTYLWSNSMTGDTLTGLASGTYSVTATDNSGCTVSGNVNVPLLHTTVIRGKIYIDFNSNCVFDAGDIPITNQYAACYGSTYAYAASNSNGDYALMVSDTGMLPVYTFFNSSNPYTTGYCPATNATIVHVIAACDTISGVDFSRGEIPGVQDLRISMVIDHSNPRAGFPNTVHLNYSNVGTVPVANTTVSLVYDSVLTYTSSSVTPSVNNTAYAEWNTGTLQPNASGSIDITLQCPTIPNGGWIGRPMYYAATINPLAGDTTPADNEMHYLRHIVASWDPNEKTCDAEEMDSLGNITPNDSVLTYTIHFQNTGNDTAYNIYVEDTLSPYLDPVTVIPGASSHPCVFELTGSGLMRFSFYNIMLPDSNHNEPASNGYVQYKVKVKPGVPLGTTIDNTGYIYFDFNPAVVTNTTSNTIMWGGLQGVAGVNSPGISAFPNPAHTNVMIFLPQETANAQNELILTDAAGRIVLRKAFTDAAHIELQLGGLDPGLYFCTLVSDGRTAGVTKIVKQ